MEEGFSKAAASPTSSLDRCASFGQFKTFVRNGQMQLNIQSPLPIMAGGRTIGAPLEPPSQRILNAADSDRKTSLKKGVSCVCGPEGIRTPVAGMRARYPRPLDDGTDGRPQIIPNRRPCIKSGRQGAAFVNDNEHSIIGSYGVIDKGEQHGPSPSPDVSCAASSLCVQLFLCRR